MVDVSSRFVVAPVCESTKSYDFAILVLVGVLAVGLAIALCANALTAGIDPSNLDLISAFP